MIRLRYRLVPRRDSLTWIGWLVIVYAARRSLPVALRPLYVMRTPDFTYLLLHEGVPLEALADLLRRSLTEQEQQVVRKACGVAPVGLMSEHLKARWREKIPEALMTVAERRREARALLETAV